MKITMYLYIDIPPECNLRCHDSLSFNNQLTVGALTIPPAAVPLVSFQTRYDAMIATPSALRSSERHVSAAISAADASPSLPRFIGHRVETNRGRQCLELIVVDLAHRVFVASCWLPIYGGWCSRRRSWPWWRHIDVMTIEWQTPEVDARGGSSSRVSVFVAIIVNGFDVKKLVVVFVIERRRMRVVDRQHDVTSGIAGALGVVDVVFQHWDVLRCQLKKSWSNGKDQSIND